MKIKIAIADDHPLVINGLRHILSHSPEMEIIGCYANGDLLMAGLQVQQPDVLLLDIQMPGRTGDILAELISVTYPAIKIIVLTNQDNIFYIKTMMKKGAVGYVLKTTREEILIEAIRTVYGGEKYLEPELRDKVVVDSISARKQVSATPILSRREKEILKFIALDLTSQEIADKLAISKRTIDQHRLSLLLKLDVKNAAALVKKAMQMGLVE